MAVTLNVRADTKNLQRTLGDFGRKQLPFATAQALTALAKRTQDAEKAAIVAVFPSATPFTQKSIRMKAARKSDLTATVSMGDIAASYLEPYEFGGKHSLGSKRGLLVPKHVVVNQYGNLTRNKIAALKGQHNVFVGAVTFKKSGQTVWGVWQRPDAGQRRAAFKNRSKGRGGLGTGHYGTKGALEYVPGGPGMTGLKLLVCAEDALPVKRHLAYFARARDVVSRSFRIEMDKALAKAMATAKP